MIYEQNWVTVNSVIFKYISFIFCNQLNKVELLLQANM